MSRTIRVSRVILCVTHLTIGDSACSRLYFRQRTSKEPTLGTVFRHYRPRVYELPYILDIKKSNLSSTSRITICNQVVTTLDTEVPLLSQRTRILKGICASFRDSRARPHNLPTRIESPVVRFDTGTFTHWPCLRQR
jgi:hypothetical protein